MKETVWGNEVFVQGGCIYVYIYICGISGTREFADLEVASL